MGDRPDQFRNRAARLKAHPFDAVRAGLETRDVHFEWPEIPFSGPGLIGRDAKVVIAPAPEDNGRRFVIPANFCSHLAFSPHLNGDSFVSPAKIEG
jgi:hypothetical protein